MTDPADLDLDLDFDLDTETETETDAGTGTLVELYSAGPPVSAPMQVAAALREVVLESSDGELLGSEVELIARFGVSRPTFRQAARILQAEGLLVVRRGTKGGLFACPPSDVGVARAVSVLLRHKGVTFQDLNAAIHALTGEIARQAAAHPDAAAREELAERVRAFVPPGDASEAEQVMAAGTHFGLGVVSLAPNPVVSVLLQVLVELLRQQSDKPPATGHYGELREFHLAVVEAVAAGDELTALQLCNSFRGRIDRWQQ